MDTEEITQVINAQPTTSFLSAEDLVSLRKPEESAPHLNVGLKFSECRKTEAEKEAVHYALDSQKAMLDQKRAARICDLMQAEWNEELNVAVAPKLKGKFVQHMGHKIDEKIALTPEEALFLIENGCLEIMHGKAPMSTEEAYATMLKQKLSIEKYLVYSYLSQLGFIVIPHQKEIKGKSQSKVTATEKNKKKRKVQSPLPEDSRNKRLTFSGALSEEADASNDTKITDECKSLLNDIAIISKSATVPSAETEDQFPNESNKTNSESQPELHSSVTVAAPANETSKDLEASSENRDQQLPLNNSEIIQASPEVNFNSENSKAGQDVEMELNAEESSSLKPLLSASAPDVETDSQNTDALMDSLEKTTGVFVADSGEGANIDTLTQSSDSQCAVINESSDMDDEQNSVLSISSCDYDELEDHSGNNLVVDDDDVTVVEVTKKETTPLAVIDLLSDEEEEQMQTGEPEAAEDSESDDDIKILEVCNGSTTSNKNSETSVNLNKIKGQKIQNCKNESLARSTSSTHGSTPKILFPELFRKEIVCVARPPLNLLPLHVQPCKEVYILDCSKIQRTNRGGGQSAPPSQGRVWNSYRDMQDYQRSLRRNRNFNRHPNQDRPWQTHPGRREEVPYRRSPNHSTDLNSAGDQKNGIARPDRIFPHYRHADSDYREHNAMRSRHNDSDHRSRFGTEDQKPFAPSFAGLLGEAPRSDLGDPTPFRNANSDSSHFPARFPPPNPLDLNNPSRVMPNLSSQDFAAEVHRTAYSYARNMLSSMFGSAFNANNFSPLAPFTTIRHNSSFGMPQPVTLMDSNSRNVGSPFANEYYPLPNGRQLHREFPRGRRYQHQTEPFPCNYRNIQNKTSWNDVRAAVGGEDEQSDSESSDIEEIPIRLNDFLWNASNICPLVKPGVKHPLENVLGPLKLTQIAKLTDKTCRNEKYFSDNQTLEITYDVYKPGTHFKKSNPGVPSLRIIVMRESDPVPRYSEIAFLQRKWGDGASLQIALVDNADVSFYSFSSVCIPDIVPFQE